LTLYSTMKRVNMRDNNIDDTYEAHVQRSAEVFGPPTAEQIAKLSTTFDYTPAGGAAA
jgi:hypothetical protein